MIMIDEKTTREELEKVYLMTNMPLENLAELETEELREAIRQWIEEGDECESSNLTNAGKGRPPGSKNKEEKLNTSYLAKRLGISREAVWHRIQKAGYKDLKELNLAIFENWEVIRAILKVANPV